MVQVQPTATGARNFSQCDSMLIGDHAGANTYPYIQVCIPAGVLEGSCKALAGYTSGWRLSLSCAFWGMSEALHGLLSHSKLPGCS